MLIEIFGENPLDFKTLKKHYNKDSSKGFESALKDQREDAKSKFHRGSTELNNFRMMSSEASQSNRMHYSFIQPGERKMTEQEEEHHSTCTVDNHHQINESSSHR